MHQANEVINRVPFGGYELLCDDKTISRRDASALGDGASSITTALAKDTMYQCYCVCIIAEARLNVVRPAKLLGQRGGRRNTGMARHGV